MPHLLTHGIQNIVETQPQLYEFLEAVVPQEIPRATVMFDTQSRDEFKADVAGGLRLSSMSLRITINWEDPANCPIFRQFIPLKSLMIRDSPWLNLDSLHERNDSPVEGLVHRYPDKALFLAIPVCPTLCLYCTRSYGVGANTELVLKEPFKLTRKRIEAVFEYIASQEDIKDIVVSGGDAYCIPPHSRWISDSILEEIGDRLINLKNIERFRFATKGLAIAPNRLLDYNDPWTDALIQVSDKARKAGKRG
ncbi:hypothetical protein ONZ43_g6857 [Nemania bipapillata]|uniref:Uncharacterized protein n=1 Tax=Nemania bipapillata TaxID=110536 RepID=A0ACC2HVM2_9PEZI|nr:hypothetical protein ONZ43_g6857 [Nemania bipapillata]